MGFFWLVFWVWTVSKQKLEINEDLQVVLWLRGIQVNDIPLEDRRVYSTVSIFSALDFLDDQNEGHDTNKLDAAKLGDIFVAGWDESFDMPKDVVAKLRFLLDELQMIDSYGNRRRFLPKLYA